MYTNRQTSCWYACTKMLLAAVVLASIIETLSFPDNPGSQEAFQNPVTDPNRRAEHEEKLSNRIPKAFNFADAVRNSVGNESESEIQSESNVKITTQGSLSAYDSDVQTPESFQSPDYEDLDEEFEGMGDNTTESIFSSGQFFNESSNSEYEGGNATVENSNEEIAVEQNADDALKDKFNVSNCTSDGNGTDYECDDDGESNEVVGETTETRDLNTKDNSSVESLPNKSDALKINLYYLIPIIFFIVLLMFLEMR